MSSFFMVKKVMMCGRCTKASVVAWNTNRSSAVISKSRSLELLKYLLSKRE